MTALRTPETIAAEIKTLHDELTALHNSNGDHVVIRSSPSGCWMGRLVSRSGSEVILADARRLWYWAGASTLSQLAIDGVQRPSDCKFPKAVPLVTVLEVCEIIPATAAAVASIASVPDWQQ